MKKLIPLALLVLLVAAPAASAQIPCFIGDDGFDIGCCNVPNPNLPPLPPMQLGGVYACINNCNPGNPLQAQIQLSAPQYVFCDYAVINVTFTVAPGMTFTGPLLAKYSRTWTEGGAGINRQVWRFLVNGDLALVPAGIAGAPCPTPPCALPPANNRVHWDGNIDYACDPTAAAGFLCLISLSHMPGCLSHAPFSAYPLPAAQAHTNISYHLVGPAPFVFAPVPEPQGPVFQDAIRPSIFSLNPFVYQCQGEADVVQGNLATQNTNCLCSPILPIVGPWKHQNLQGTACCGGAVFPFNSLPLPGFVLPTGLAAQTLGAWGGAIGGFPGARQLTFYVGVLINPGPSAPCPLPPAFNGLNVVTGVATTNHPGQVFVGPVAPCGPIAAVQFRQWIDLQNMLILVNVPAGGNPLPGIGGLFASDRVFQLNIP